MSKFIKAIEEVKESINPDYELCYDEFQAIRAMSEDEFNLIYNSFLFGYMQGRNATLEEMKTRV